MEQCRYIYTQFKKSKHFLKKYSAIYKTLTSKTYNCFNNKGIKHITTLRLELCLLWEHKVKYGFLDSLNPICSADWLLKQLVIFYSIAPILEMKDLFY